MLNLSQDERAKLDTIANEINAVLARHGFQSMLPDNHATVIDITQSQKPRNSLQSMQDSYQHREVDPYSIKVVITLGYKD